MARLSAAAGVSGLFTSKFGIARGAVSAIVADSATLTDANIPKAQALSCQGYDTIFVGVEITAGSSPTMTIEPLFRDDDAADGSRWRRFLVGSPDGVTAAAAAVQTTGALAPDLTMVEIRVFGQKSVFLRVSAVANAAGTTAWNILVAPGKARNTANLSRS